MNKIKKIKFTVIMPLVALVICFGLATAVIAQEDTETPTEETPVSRLQNTGVAAGYGDVTADSFPHAVGRIIQVFMSILGIIFMAYTVYAGYLWMTASGEEEKITKAKSILRGSIIGLIIVLSAYIITATVVDRFSKAGNQDIIQSN